MILIHFHLAIGQAMENCRHAENRTLIVLHEYCSSKGGKVVFEFRGLDSSGQNGRNDRFTRHVAFGCSCRSSCCR